MATLEVAVRGAELVVQSGGCHAAWFRAEAKRRLGARPAGHRGVVLLDNGWNRQALGELARRCFRISAVEFSCAPADGDR